MPRSAANLSAWLNEPYVQDAVVAVLKRGEYPLTLREIAEEAGHPIQYTNRVLGRLHRRGAVTRYKLAMQRHAYCHKLRRCIPGAARRMLFVYSWAAEGARAPDAEK